MAKHRCEARRGRTPWRWLRGGLVSVLAGCQAVPAPIAICGRTDTHGERCAVVARQVLADTGMEIAQHPLRSAGTALIEPLLPLSETGAGLRKRLVTQLGPVPGPIVPWRPTLDIDALEQELHHRAGDDLKPACVRLITDGHEALEALEEALDQATCQIDVLMFLWDNDPLGWQIAKRIAARASPTLHVRILVDGGGNLIQGEPESAGIAEVNAVVAWLARQPHVRVIRTRNPFCRFDHRKLVIVDGRIVWSGGRNFTHEAFFEAHDLTYIMTGPLTGDLTTRFSRFWQEQGGPPSPPPPPPLSTAGANTMARLVRTRPFEANLARTIYTAVDRAKHHIFIENPYFRDNVLINKLVQARQRGVDVRVVMTLDSGSHLIDLVNRVTVNRLLQAGIRVYLYPGRTHVKAMSVDGLWAYFGTGNFDPLSLRHNRELGLAVSHGALVDELETRLFLPDFRPEWEARQPVPWTAGEFVAELVVSIFG
jgi:cardiolipin synthase